MAHSSVRYRISILCVSLLAIVLLLQPAPIPMQAAPAPQGTLNAAGTYTEDFSSYTAKDYTDDAVWDIWNQQVRVGKYDAINQRFSTLEIDSTGNIVGLWIENDSIYAQKIDPQGNRLWPADVQVNTDVPSEGGLLDLTSTIDSDGNIFVLWKSKSWGSTSEPRIYVQKIDPNGQRLWASDRPIISSHGTPDIAADNNGIVVAYNKKDGGIYVQRIDSAGNSQWTTDVRVNGGEPGVAVSGNNRIWVVWGAGNDPGSGSIHIYAQMLDTNGNAVWPQEQQITTSEIESANLVISTDSQGSALIVWCNA